jgi:signal recognition particle subunit SRP54
MFQSLTNGLNKIFSKLKSKGSLTESDINEAMREIRIALIEADVSVQFIKDFIAIVKEKALGQEVIKSITPGQMIVKIVQDELEEILYSPEEEQQINLRAKPPVNILMVGLQGGGKTTSSAKLASYLKKQGKRALLVSLDIYRPAAREQLETLAKNTEIDSLPIIQEEKPLEIVKRAKIAAEKGSYDVVIYDSAGRLHIDSNLMEELKQITKETNPSEILLTVDALTGQDAVNIATEFDQNIGITGIILTRIDGDSRGGAAISMKYVTGKPIKFLGTGEKITNFEVFDNKRIASRILGMGDVVSLVEKAIEAIDQDETAKMTKRLQSGKFDLSDFLSYIRTMKKMGGIDNIASMLPSMGIDLSGKGKELQKAEIMVKKQEAIILSMTPKERMYPALMNGSRKRRIALGAAVEVQDVNKLLKQHQQVEKMMKKLSKMNPLSFIKNKFSGMFG